MTYKIIADSSCNVYKMNDINYESVAMKILANDQEFVDSANIDLEAMFNYFTTYNGKSTTSCPNIADWLNTFEGNDEIYAFTITSKLSGAYNACMQAKAYYESENPNAKVFVMDTLSCGGEIELLINKTIELKKQGLTYEEVVTSLQAYHNHTHLIFMLKSVDNLAKNGRVNAALAKVIGLLGIRLVGKANDGVLEVLNKVKGSKKAIQSLYQVMLDHNYQGGKVIINHAHNEKDALALEDLILANYPNAEVKIDITGALCSYYAEEGGLIIGYEDHLSTIN